MDPITINLNINLSEQQTEWICGAIGCLAQIIDHDADGNPYPKCEQTAKCGNAVTPPVACALVRANLPELCEGRENIC